MKRDCSALIEYLNTEVHPEELAEVLERMLWDYVNYCLGDSNYTGNDEVAGDVWTVKELIAALKQCK